MFCFSRLLDRETHTQMAMQTAIVTTTEITMPTIAPIEIAVRALL